MNQQEVESIDFDIMIESYEELSNQDRDSVRMYIELKSNVISFEEYEKYWKELGIQKDKN